MGQVQKGTVKNLRGWSALKESKTEVLREGKTRPLQQTNIRERETETRSFQGSFGHGAFIPHTHLRGKPHPAGFRLSVNTRENGAREGKGEIAI